MPPDERYAGEKQQLSATKSMSTSAGPPASGWIRNTDLARASGSAGLLSTSNRHKILHELSQVRVLLWLRRKRVLVESYPSTRKYVQIPPVGSVLSFSLTWKGVPSRACGCACLQLNTNRQRLEKIRSCSLCSSARFFHRAACTAVLKTIV